MNSCIDSSVSTQNVKEEMENLSKALNKWYSEKEDGRLSVNMNIVTTVANRLRTLESYYPSLISPNSPIYATMIRKRAGVIVRDTAVRYLNYYGQGDFESSFRAELSGIFNASVFPLYDLSDVICVTYKCDENNIFSMYSVSELGDGSIGRDITGSYLKDAIITRFSDEMSTRDMEVDTVDVYYYIDRKIGNTHFLFSQCPQQNLDKKHNTLLRNFYKRTKVFKGSDYYSTLRSGMQSITSDMGKSTAPYYLISTDTPYGIQTALLPSFHTKYDFYTVKSVRNTVNVRGVVMKEAELTKSGINKTIGAKSGWTKLTKYNPRVGDLVSYKKHGDLSLVKVNKEVSSETIPVKCPSCGSPLKINYAGNDLLCTDIPRCPEIAIKSITSSLNILGVDEIRLTLGTALYNKGYRSLADYFRSRVSKVPYLKEFDNSVIDSVNAKLNKILKTGISYSKLIRMFTFSASVPANFKRISELYTNITDLSNDVKNKEFLLVNQKNKDASLISNARAEFVNHSPHVYSSLLEISTLLEITHQTRPRNTLTVG